MATNTHEPQQHITPIDETHCDVVVIGGGPGGYSAAFRCADLGLNTIIVEQHKTLGGVCLNVGCIPSKALLHVASVIEEATHLGEVGIDISIGNKNVEVLRKWKDATVKKLTSGLSGLAKQRKVAVIQGNGQFSSPNTLQIVSNDNQSVVRFKYAIIASGSRAITLPNLPNDPRVITATGALALPKVPENMLVIGGGIIGLEMATVYSSLGSTVDIVEMGSQLMAGADNDLVNVWRKFNNKNTGKIFLEARAANAIATDSGIEITLEKINDKNSVRKTYQLVLVAIGRAPNSDTLGLANAGVTSGTNGFIPVNSMMQTNIPHIYAIGDVVGQPMLAHKAVHEGHLAAECIAGKTEHSLRSSIPSVAYTNPEVAWVGLTENHATKHGIPYDKAIFPWAASGRALANGRSEGLTKLLIDPATKRIVGAGIVGTNAGELIGELCVAINLGATAAEIAETIHPHPTLCETIAMAAESYEGKCTDLPQNK